MRIIIIGGGIGGLTLAHACEKEGLDWHLYERAPAFREIGAAISVFPNALRVLTHLGLAEAIIAKAGRLNAGYFRKPNGTIIVGQDFSRYGLPILCMHRADLLAALYNTLPQNRISLGHEITGITESDSAVTASFDSPTLKAQASADVLVGADGIHSIVRKHVIQSDSPLRYSGYTAWRGFTQLDPKKADELVAGETVGRGVRMGVVPIGEGRTGWWIAVSEAAGNVYNPQETRERLLRLCGDWHWPARELIENTHEIIKTDLYDRAPTRQISSNRVILIGDAAHPTTPNLGQGGCLAIEDALLLVRCLKHDNTLKKAFTRYENMRWPRVKSVVEESRQLGSVFQMQNPIGSALRDALLPILARFFGVKSFVKYWDYDAGKVELQSHET